MVNARRCATVDLAGDRQRRDDRHRHAGNAEQVAAARGQRMRQAFEREDEEDAGDEVEQGDDVRRASRAPSSGRFACACLLALRLLLLEHLEHPLGDEEPAEGVDGHQRNRQGAENACRPIDAVDPAARIAPTMITELMALVTLISGVCSAGVTCPDHVVADEDGQHEDRQVRDDGVDRDSVHQSALTAAPSIQTSVAAMISSARSNFSSPVLGSVSRLMKLRRFRA